MNNQAYLDHIQARILEVCTPEEIQNFCNKLQTASQPIINKKSICKAVKGELSQIEKYYELRAKTLQLLGPDLEIKAQAIGLPKKQVRSYREVVLNKAKKVSCGIRTHRSSGSTVIPGYTYNFNPGTVIWLTEDGELHREDGPAVIHPKTPNDKVAPESWFLNGMRHREDGPAITHGDGTTEWYKDGELHRIGGPAVEDSNGRKEWYRDGVRHRDDGPAFIGAAGLKQWWIAGQLVQEHIWDAREQKHIEYIRGR